ncbi:DUF4388 domain-containing protein [Thermogemmatispora tikiterensis]|jgi:hypothetical protein|uniref:PatA-like N-terminal domain-containing protein n=1 Tax=Thermogemmatispora tikiterensis TaxID=1825093 RepID=A0A328VHF2_9CHLR|nr:DUF4388 domain-containing protein [Thermogemmatispora tikiterensis]RAQ96311.1 hypothetical protein A4R35_12265 [Thermogemmatispora tikiterensis]
MTTNTRLLQGSLRDFGLVEILQMMELGSATGALHLKHEQGRVGILYFSDGKIANCSELDSCALTLGDVLQQLGMATYQEVELAFNQQLQDAFGRRIGERLIAMRVINEQQLYEALRTKALWTARELALWREGTYEFITSPKKQAFLPYGEQSLDLEIVRVTMEMVRYADEWEQLKLYLPNGMRTVLQLVPAIPYPLSFNGRVIEVLQRVAIHRWVRKVATGLRRPELEVARDLAALVQQRLIVPLAEEPHPPSRGARTVRLPGPAERMRMESFELLNLISRMEQDWYKRKSPVEQLPALVHYINWTMEALAETCRANGTDLDPNTLEALLTREHLRYMGNYKFIIQNNRIDVENFTALCHEVLHGDLQRSKEFYEEALSVLSRILRVIFETINSRVASLYERLENQEVWEAFFSLFEPPQN